jgi:hypothetical protein
MSLKIIQHMKKLLKNNQKFTDKDEILFVHKILEAIEKKSQLKKII